jgi:hypothetical protein
MPTLLTTLLVLLTGVVLARVMARRLVAWAVPAIVLKLEVGFLLGSTLLPFEAIRPLSGITELGVLTKLLCGLGITAADHAAGVDRWLVLATTALSAGVINGSQFSALVIMVTLTTVLGLLLLQRRLAFVRRVAENPS